VILKLAETSVVKSRCRPSGPHGANFPRSVRCFLQGSR